MKLLTNLSTIDCLDVERPIYLGVEQGMAQAHKGDTDAAMSHMVNSRRQAAALIPRLHERGRKRVQLFKRTGRKDHSQAAHGDLMAVKRLKMIVSKVDDAVRILRTPEPQKPGQVWSPPPEGYYLRVPFQSMGDGALAAGIRFETLAPANFNVRMETPLLSWLQAEAVGVVVESFDDGNANSILDQISIEDVRVRGLPNLVLGEGPIDIAPYRLGKGRFVGFREHLPLSKTNQAELRVRSLDNLDAACAGTNEFIAALVIKVVWDDAHKDRWAHGIHNKSLMGGMGGRETWAAAPTPGTQEPVPLTVITADAINAANSSAVRLDNTRNRIALQTEAISWQDSWFTGFMCSSPVLQSPLDRILLDDCRARGFAVVTPQEGETPIELYMGEHTAAQGGLMIPGMRAYPEVSESNRFIATAQLRDSGGAVGNTNNVDGGDNVARMAAWALYHRKIGAVHGFGRATSTLAPAILEIFDGFDFEFSGV